MCNIYAPYDKIVTQALDHQGDMPFFKDILNLDIRTMMVTVSSLTFLFAGLLALAGLHAGNTRGVWHWALASLCISLGLGVAYIQLSSGSSWMIVFGAVLLASGMGLQLVGIQAYKNVPTNWQLAGGFIGLVFLQSAWFSIHHFDPGSRAILNSLAYAAINLLCARELMVRAELPLRTAYRFTAFIFVLLAIVLVGRAVAIIMSPPGSYALYSNLLINPITFFVASMTQLCLTFGFVLMLNYQLATDLKRMASRDSLTGAFNRRSLEEEGARLWARCSRSGESLGIMMIDIDHFKLINDRFGHSSGDEVLRRLTEIATNSIRTEDYFARYGGEEFCILLPSISEDEAFKLAERLRLAYAATNLEFDGEAVSSTISIGVAISKPHDVEFHSLVEVGDQALYRAKQHGRNRVMTGSMMVPC